MDAGSARPRHLRHRGFKLVELLVVILLVAAVFSFLLPVVQRAREYDGRLPCPEHLRQIGQALLLYSNENHGNYPRTKYDPDSPTVTFYTGVNAANPFSPDGPSSNDVTAAYFLLMRTEGMTPNVFICPSADNVEAWDFAGGSEQTRSNWPSRQFLSYSFANPYPSPAAAAAGYKLSSSMNSDLAIASDMNPGNAALLTIGSSVNPTEMRMANSLNHGKDGQNVLYADGHVAFWSNPFVGVKGDNIFTYGDCGPTMGGSGIVGSPVGPDDSVLLPTQLDGPAVGPIPKKMGDIFKEHSDIIAVAFAFVVIVMVIVFGIDLWKRLCGQSKKAGGQ